MSRIGQPLYRKLRSRIGIAFNRGRKKAPLPTNLTKPNRRKRRQKHSAGQRHTFILTSALSPRNCGSVVVQAGSLRPIGNWPLRKSQPITSRRHPRNQQIIPRQPLHDRQRRTRKRQRQKQRLPYITVITSLPQLLKRLPPRSPTLRRLGRQNESHRHRKRKERLPERRLQVDQRRSRHNPQHSDPGSYPRIHHQHALPIHPDHAAPQQVIRQ